ncbi:MAG: beta-ketoacyl-ACP synthase II [Deltaproteobacteria bacterium]|nr:beta-ketoacyl-ACP synthase II [Deltaproteobacteria bacterium]
MRSPDPKRVAVTGLGLVTPLGLDLESTWSSLLAGQSGVGPITRFDPAGSKTKIAAEVRGFRPEDFLDKKSVRRTDPFIQFAVAASKMAVADSGINIDQELSGRIGCALGCGLGGLGMIEANHTIIMNGRSDRISPFFIPMMIGNMAPGIVAIELGLKGPNYLIATACAAGSHAVGLAFQSIRDHGYEAMVCGGTESVITPLSVAGFNAVKALSTRNNDPRSASRPFDLNRDGFVMGEGAGVLVLEEMTRAKARGAKIYAEVLGFGVSCDAFHYTAPPEDGEGAVSAMEEAIKDAGPRGFIKEDIGYINAHGTSTEINDAVETLAVRQVFGARADRIPISSTKSMTGHLLGAAGGVEASISALVLQRGVIPGTINLDTPDPRCDLDYVADGSRKAEVKAVMSNSFGFGGTNGVLIFGKPEAFE